MLTQLLTITHKFPSLAYTLHHGHVLSAAGVGGGPTTPSRATAFAFAFASNFSLLTRGGRFAAVGGFSFGGLSFAGFPDDRHKVYNQIQCHHLKKIMISL